MTDNAILEGLKTGDNAYLKHLYLEHKAAFLNFTKNYGITKNNALDIYQDAILALSENIATGKLTSLNSSLKTYLFSIGKYMVFDYLRAKNKLRHIDDNHFNSLALKIDFDFDVLFKKESNQTEKKLELAFNKLGIKCKTILKLFYYQNYNAEEIVELLEYKSKDVVKSQKYRCLKHLKEIFENER